MDGVEQKGTTGGNRISINGCKAGLRDVIQLRTTKQCDCSLEDCQSLWDGDQRAYHPFGMQGRLRNPCDSYMFVTCIIVTILLSTCFGLRLSGRNRSL